LNASIAAVKSIENDFSVPSAVSLSIDSFCALTIASKPLIVVACSVTFFSSATAFSSAALSASAASLAPSSSATIFLSEALTF